MALGNGDGVLEHENVHPYKQMSGFGHLFARFACAREFI